MNSTYTIKQAHPVQWRPWVPNEVVGFKNILTLTGQKLLLLAGLRMASHEHKKDQVKKKYNKTRFSELAEYPHFFPSSAKCFERLFPMFNGKTNPQKTLKKTTKAVGVFPCVKMQQLPLSTDTQREGKPVLIHKR